MKVKAKSLGYYGNERRREGDVFVIKNEKAFSSKWMEVVPPEPKAEPKVAVPPKEEADDEVPV